MIEVCCTCSWGIPGVDALPPHVHRTRRVFRNDETGKEVVMTADLHCMDNPGYTIGPPEEIILFSVDWKAVARS